ncbi:membrane bound o-acyl transferase family protein [Sarocladium implicatum]|nr:membrane bound o-acyl transferase family protein [Sarocladium implicatum]
MDALQPLALYLCAMTLMMASLYREQHQRTTLLGPIWAILCLAFTQTKHVPPELGLNAQYGMLVTVTFIWAPVLLTTTARKLSLQNPHLDIPSAYRLFNNPREILLLPPQRLPAPATTRLRFAAQGILTCFLIIASLSLRDRLLAAYLSTYTVADFSPSREWLLPRLVSGELTVHDLGVRTYVSLAWIYDTCSQLVLVHTLLSLFFVLLLQVDEPEEWPPLFRSPLKAYTVRRFWGTYWHRLLTPTAIRWAKFITARVPLLRRQKGAEKLFVAWFVFTVSGVAHVLVGWQLGDAALRRDLYFFWANFGVIGFEIVLEKVAASVCRHVAPDKGVLSHPYLRIFGRVLGCLWVVFWFIMTIPHILFPKTYAAIRMQMLARGYKVD